MVSSPARGASGSNKRSSPSRTVTPRSSALPERSRSNRSTNPDASTAQNLASTNYDNSGHNVSNALRLQSTRSPSAVIVGSTSPPQPDASTAEGAQPSGYGASSYYGAARPRGALINQKYLDINQKVATILEILFSFVGASANLALWTYLMFIARCINLRTYWLSAVLIMVAIAFVCNLFTLFHGWLDRSIAIGRGIIGCFLFFQLSVVAFSSFLLAYWSLWCICRCYEDTSTIDAGSVQDLVIFTLSMSSGLSIVALLVVASVAHE